MSTVAVADRPEIPRYVRNRHPPIHHSTLTVAALDEAHHFKMSFRNRSKLLLNRDKRFADAGVGFDMAKSYAVAPTVERAVGMALSAPSTKLKAPL